MWASVVVARGLSSCGSQALECRLSSRGTWAYLLHGMWDLPGPGLEPVSPALAGGFLTTAPPGKSNISSLKSCLFKAILVFICTLYIETMILRLFLSSKGYYIIFRNEEGTNLLENRCYYMKSFRLTLQHLSAAVSYM